MKALRILLIVCPATLSAQDSFWQGTVELPAHRVLMQSLDEGAALAPFTTDGCSGGLSESWRLVADWFPEFAQAHHQTPPWEACCVTHDRAYHNAGGATEAGQSFSERLTADQALRDCVRTIGQDRMSEVQALYDVSEVQVTQAYEAIAEGMFLAVRFGGGPCSGLPWRWGYGYPQCSILSLGSKTD